MTSEANKQTIQNPLAGEIASPGLRDFFLRIQNLGSDPAQPPYAEFDLLSFERHIPCTVLCLCSVEDQRPVVQFNGSDYVQATGSDYTSRSMECNVRTTKGATRIVDVVVSRQPLLTFDNPLPDNRPGWTGYDSIICPLFCGPDVVAVVSVIDLFR